jgi:hypothetical protein
MKQLTTVGLVLILNPSVHSKYQFLHHKTHQSSAASSSTSPKHTLYLAKHHENINQNLLWNQHYRYTAFKTSFTHFTLSSSSNLQQWEENQKYLKVVILKKSLASLFLCCQIKKDLNLLISMDWGHGGTLK